jgi:putative phosphoesterase
MKIGVISDTHNFLDPQVPKLFAGVEHILHGGDIGLPKILLELVEIAPVTAVMGNTDEARFNYWETKVIELAKRKFLLHHIVSPHSLSEGFQDHLARVGPDAVIFGHTHKPFCETIGGILFFNPGYAGKSRFGLARSVAILHCDEQGIRPEFVPL